MAGHRLLSALPLAGDGHPHGIAFKNAASIGDLKFAK
jgi:hypothetical protein